ncbi:hypothetical protein C5167_009066 [Papaver somniferum]|uniref:Bet v I/Major latex protein domain-containing protein n=1 Tax=Papaver somniferum TaxID=3469 RepID=A0A4Y7K0B5_PAPSO|nr:uncharacterized protein LOC113285679 [Papaver somniferum]RZC65379.1 hypothetical protein C5167_009066 [Papaver somniferum]
MQRLSEEAVLNIPASKAWSMYRDDKLISKINPDMLSGAEYIKGDGGPGSLRVFKLGPAVHSYVKESTQKIEKVVEGQSVTYEVIGGELKDMYNFYRVTFSFLPVPEKEDEQCIAEWKSEYEPLSATTSPPEKARDAAIGFLKSFEKFGLC